MQCLGTEYDATEMAGGEGKSTKTDSRAQVPRAGGGGAELLTGAVSVCSAGNAGVHHTTLCTDSVAPPVDRYNDSPYIMQILPQERLTSMKTQVWGWF